MGLFSSW